MSPELNTCSFSHSYSQFYTSHSHSHSQTDTDATPRPRLRLAPRDALARAASTAAASSQMIRTPWLNPKPLAPESCRMTSVAGGRRHEATTDAGYHAIWKFYSSRRDRGCVGRKRVKGREGAENVTAWCASGPARPESNARMKRAGWAWEPERGKPVFRPELPISAGRTVHPPGFGRNRGGAYNKR